MASTPSASALSAVLRCRGNLLSRNPPTKRPATPADSLGLAGGAVRDSTSERCWSKQTSTWERISLGKGLTAACTPSRPDGKTLRKKEDRREINDSCQSKLSQSRIRATQDSRSPVPDTQNAPVRQPVFILTPNLPGMNSCSQLIRMIKYQIFAPHICKTIFYQNIVELTGGVLNVSVTLPGSREKEAQIPSFILNGWSRLKSTCLSLTVLVSEIVFVKLGVLWSSRPDHAPQKQDMKVKNIKTDALQVNGQIRSSTDLNPSKDNSNSGQIVTEDRPD